MRSRLGQHHQSEGAKPDCVTRLDRDRAAGINHAWNSRLRCRDKRPAVSMAYRRAERRLGEMMARRRRVTAISVAPAISRTGAGSVALRLHALCKWTGEALGRVRGCFCISLAERPSLFGK